MKELLKKLTLREKIGQMMMIGFRGTELQPGSDIHQHISQFKPGGVWLTDNDSPLGKTLGNIESPEQVKKLTGDLQLLSSTPLFISIDAEGGKVIRLKEQYGFPETLSAKQLGATNDPEFTYSESEKIAELLKELGININFAPVVDIELNPDNLPLAKKERCFGDNVFQVTEHARQVIKAHRKHNIGTVLKHFPGHGSSADDSHIDLVDVSDTWREEELEPYKMFIAERLADMVLSAHVRLRRFDEEHPGTFSKKILTDLLRNKLGFEGVVFSDDLNMGAVYRNYNYNEALVLAINAGVDIIMQGNVMNYEKSLPEQTFEGILEAVEKGSISEKRIDQSVERILNLKQKSGLFENYSVIPG